MILEASTTAISSVADVFTNAGAIMSGFVGMGIDFVTTLLGNPIGQILILLPIGIKAGNFILKKFKRA